VTCPSLPLQVRYRDDRLFQIDRFEVTYIAPSTVKQHHANESIFLEDGYLINTRSLGSCSPYICPSLGISRPSPAEARVPGASSAFPDPLVYRMQKLESFTGAFPPFLEHASLSRRILRRKRRLSSCRTSTCRYRNAGVGVCEGICDRMQLRATRRRLTRSFKLGHTLRNNRAEICLFVLTPVLGKSLEPFVFGSRFEHRKLKVRFLPRTPFFSTTCSMRLHLLGMAFGKRYVFAAGRFSSIHRFPIRDSVRFRLSYGD